MRKFFLLTFFLFFSSLVYALQYECVISGGKAYCNIPLEPYWEKIVDTWKKIVRVYKNVKTKLILFGTEYSPKDDAKIFLQLLEEGIPINNASCLLDLYYPDKTKWLDDAVMMYLERSDGLYYYELIIPDKLGVYMLTVRCFYVVDFTQDYVDNFTLIQGEVLGGNYTDTWKDDEEYHKILEEKIPPNYFLDVYYNFTEVQVPSNYTGMTIYWVGRWDDPEENVKIYLWDFCNSTWYQLTNQISSNTPMVSNFISKQEYPVNCLLQDGVMEIRFKDTEADGSQSNFWTDLLEVQMNYLTYGVIELIRGGGELHVSSLPEKVWERFFTLGTPPLMESTQYYCKDNMTLVKNMTFEYCESPPLKCTTYSKIEEDTCTYGCDFERNKCNPPPWQRNALVFGSIFLAIFIVLIILRLVRWI